MVDADFSSTCPHWVSPEADSVLQDGTADGFIQKLDKELTNLPAHLVLCGHSLGGAVASATCFVGLPAQVPYNQIHLCLSFLPSARITTEIQTPPVLLVMRHLVFRLHTQRCFLTIALASRSCSAIYCRADLSRCQSGLCHFWGSYGWQQCAGGGCDCKGLEQQFPAHCNTS